VTDRTLQISTDLALPLEAQTRTFVVYGGKGRGKSNFGAVVCEEFYRAGLKFFVIDPLDVFWGLRHGKQKDEQGIDVVILGGPHGDLPIEAGAGSTTADFVVDEPVSVVVVMRHATGKMWTSGERIRFTRDFVRRLFERQGESRQPLHLIIDEAGRFVPQQMPARAVDIAECVGAIEELVEWGRNVGVGVTLITQRSAKMNKSVSELAECMVAFQTAGPRSIAAVVDWFGEHVPKDRQHELVAILRKLPVGRALIVSPEFLDFEGEVQVRHRWTFDSSATPKAGAKPAKPGKRRAVDLEAYRVKLGETIAKAEAEDPKALLRRIRELEAAQSKPATAGGQAATAVLVSQATAAIAHEHAAGIAQLRKRFDEMSTRLANGFGSLQAAAIGAVDAAQAFGEAVRHQLGELAADPIWTGTPRPSGMPGRVVVTQRPAEIRAEADRRARQIFDDNAGAFRLDARVPANGDGSAIPAGAVAVLNALAQLEQHGVPSASASRVAPIAGTRRTSSTWRGYLATLRRAGLVQDLPGGLLTLTAAGRACASGVPLFGSRAELQRHWLGEVGPAKVVLGPLLESEGGAIDRSELARLAGVTTTSSTWRGYLATLRRYGLIRDEPDGSIAASDVLYPPGLA